MLAYFILVHRYPEQFRRMFSAIYSAANRYVIHVDKRSGPAFRAQIQGMVAGLPQVELIESYDALWGGYSLVDAELRGMTRLLQMAPQWRHFINLSGQDFPLKSQRYIGDFLAAHAGCEFIRAVDQRQVRPDTMNRVNSIHLESKGAMRSTGVERPFLSHVTPFIGTQWKAVSRQFCEFVTAHPDAQRFKTFYSASFIADEGFFQTVMMNTPHHGRMMNDDLRKIDWVPDGDIKLRPRNFGVQDMPELAASPDLFARKFDQGTDPLVLGLLEAHLKTASASQYLHTCVPV
jgi:Core-2/I-Branching enzyme